VLTGGGTSSDVCDHSRMRTQQGRATSIEHTVERRPAE
jgi:hypothetical protein